MSADDKVQNLQSVTGQVTIKRSWALRLLAGGFALLFAIVLIVQIALFAGVGWINSQGGQEFVKAQLDVALGGSGYEVEFSGLRYSPLTAILLEDLRISDMQGEFLSARDVRLAVGLFPLAAKMLAVGVNAQEVVLLRAPISQENKPQAPLFAPIIVPVFTLPDMYFTSFILDTIHIKKLILQEQGVELSPLLSGDVRLDDQTIVLDLDFSSEDDLPALLFEGRYDTARSVMDVTKLSAAQGDFSTDLKGQLDFTAQGKSALEISPVIAPIQDARITLNFENTDKGINGLVVANAQYGDSPVMFNAPFDLAGDFAKLNNFAAQGFGLDLGGDISANVPAQKLDVVMRKIEGAGISLSGLKAYIQKKDEQNLAVSVSTNGTLHKPFNLDASALFNQKQQSLSELLASVKLGKGSLKINGAASAEMLDITLAANNFPMEDLIGGALPPSIAAISLSTQTHLSGAPAAPIIKSKTSFSPLQVIANAPKLDIGMNATYEAGQANVNLSVKGKGIKDFSALAAMPLELSLWPFNTDFTMQKIVKGKASVKGDAGALAGLFLPPDQIVRGNITLDAILDGALENPDFSGDLRVSKGFYENKAVGFSLQDIIMKANVTPKALRIEDLRASDGEGGRFDGGGVYALDGSGLEMSVKAKNLHLLKGQLADGTFDADIQLSGQSGNYKLGGVIAPKRVEINIPETYSASIPQLNIVEPKNAKKQQNTMGGSIVIDMVVDAPSQIFVRGWGLDAEFGGSLEITGNIAKPQFNGVLKSTRGRYSEFGKNFKIARANMNFSGTIPPTPIMDIMAQTQADDITAQIEITGALIKPEFGFSSVPPLPQDEVLAKILFGKDMDDISPMQAAQLAQTIRRFSGKGGGAAFDPLGLVRDVTGLDDVRVESDGAGGASVGAGKYLTDKVYLEFETGAAQNSSGANLEIEVTPSINIESKIGQDAQGGAGVFWHWDY